MATYSKASPYLRTCDLSVNEDTVLTIRSYEKQDMMAQRKGGRRRVRRPVLYFEERKECLALNNPNGKAICNLYGEEMDNWIGKQIALFVDPSVQMRGQRVCGIRVRLRVITEAEQYLKQGRQLRDEARRVLKEANRTLEQAHSTLLEAMRKEGEPKSDQTHEALRSLVEATKKMKKMMRKLEELERREPLPPIIGEA
jgi:hypothetical protein